MARLSTPLFGLSLLCMGALAALPATAASTASCRDTLVHDDSGQLVSQVDVDAPTILAGLRARGVHALNVESWGGCARADVRQPDGRIKFEFFDPYSLQRLSPG